jgi:hypothetical protein
MCLSLLDDLDLPWHDDLDICQPDVLIFGEVHSYTFMCGCVCPLLEKLLACDGSIMLTTHGIAVAHQSFVTGKESPMIGALRSPVMFSSDNQFDGHSPSIVHSLVMGISSDIAGTFISSTKR